MGMINRPRSQERTLRGPVPADFEAFYRSNLRYYAGRRILSAELAERYSAWADEVGAQRLGQRAIRQAMKNIGHGHRKSSLILYSDVAFAERVPDVADNFPNEADFETIENAALLDRINTAIAELSAIREQVARA